MHLLCILKTIRILHFLNHKPGVFTFLRGFRVFGFGWGSYAFRGFTAGVLLLHLTQVHVDGPLGAADVHGDGVLVETHQDS